MKEDQLKQILLFFFFVTLNDQRSKELARDTWFWCLDKKKKNPDMDPQQILLLSLNKFWKEIESEPRTGLASFSADSGWLLPQNLRLEPWKEFQKTSSADELFITVLNQILHIPENLLTDVLGFSAGTIRYRLAKTTRKIGKSVELHKGARA